MNKYNGPDYPDTHCDPSEPECNFEWDWYFGHYFDVEGAVLMCTVHQKLAPPEAYEKEVS